MSTVALAVRTWLRYVAPLTVLAVVAMVPVIWIGLKTATPADGIAARSTLRSGWILAAAAWSLQLWLVAGVAPVIRGVAQRAPLSQAAALADGARSLVRGLVPCLLAVIAVLLGAVALAVPGLVLLVLLATTGASDQLGEPVPAPLVDGVGAARTGLRIVAIAVGAMLAIDLGIALAAQLAIVPAWPKKPPPGMLVAARTFVRVIAIGLVAASPAVACAIAAAYERARRA